jgi:aminoglycoside phosphotransferase (APT) family kinase protein
VIGRKLSACRSAGDALQTGAVHPSDGPGGVDRRLTTAFPDLAVTSAVPLGEGEDHLAVLVNGELVVRFAREAGGRAIEREAAVLRFLAGRLPLPIPVPAAVAGDGAVMAYPLLPGEPLLRVPGTRRPAVGAALGRFLRALNDLDPAPVRHLLEVDDDPLTDWLDGARADAVAVHDLIPARHREAVERFLDAPPPAGAPATALAHTDLGAEHVLIEPDRGAVTAIIDWGDVALADPARDLGKLQRDLDPADHAAAVTAYGPLPDPGVPERATFHARCALLEDLAYAHRYGRPEYLANSLAAFPRLFAGGSSAQGGRGR